MCFDSVVCLGLCLVYIEFLVCGLYLDYSGFNCCCLGGVLMVSLWLSLIMVFLISLRLGGFMGSCGLCYCCCFRFCGLGGGLVCFMVTSDLCVCLFGLVVGC